MIRIVATIVAVLCMFPLSSMAADPAAGAKSSAPEASAITMYVLPQCGYCERAREWMRARELVWTELDISTSESALQAFKSKGGQGTPLIVVGDNNIVGFQPARMEQLMRAVSPKS